MAFNDKLKQLQSVVDIYAKLDKHGDGIEASMKNTEKYMAGSAKSASQMAGKDGELNGAGSSVMASPGLPAVIGSNGMPNQPQVNGGIGAQVTNPGAKGPNGMPNQPQIKINPGTVDADPSKGWENSPFADIKQIPLIGGLLSKLATPAKMAYMGLPTVQQSVEYEYNRNRAAFAGFGGEGSRDSQENNVRNMATDLGKKGVQTSATDVVEALNSSRSLGTNITGIGNSLALASNLTPGIGFGGAASALTGLNAARNVNYLKVIGVNVRDAATGTMRDLKLIVEDLWSTLNKQKRGGSAITKKDLHMSLQPGNALDSLLEQYFGNDPMTRKIIEDGLFAKASGVVDLGSQEQLSAAGVIPDGIKSKAKRDASASNLLGQFTDSIVQGFETANKVASTFSDVMVKISNIPGFKQLSMLFAGGKGFADTVTGFAGGVGGELLDMVTGIPFMAEGGPTQARNTYVVGEKGPELYVPHGGGQQRMIGVNGPEFFAPEKDGQIIPNHKLNFAGFMHEGGNVTTTKVGDGHSHPTFDKGTPHKHGSPSGTIKNGGRQIPEPELREILKRAGWKTPEDIENGLKIISAESGRKSNSENFVGPDVSYGLFQINMKNDWGGGPNEDMGKRRLADYRKYGVNQYWDLYDPEKNAKVAWAVSSQGRQFDAWSTKHVTGLDGPKFGHPRRNDPWYDSLRGKAWALKEGVVNVGGKVVNKVVDVAGGVYNAAKDTVVDAVNATKSGIGNILSGISGIGMGQWKDFIKQLTEGVGQVIAGFRAEGGPVSAAGSSGGSGYNVNYGGITIKIEGSNNWDERKLASEIKKALDYDNLIRRAVSK